MIQHLRVNHQNRATDTCGIDRFMSELNIELHLLNCNAKSRAEHDRASCYNELNNTRAAVDQVAREKVTCRP